MNEDDTARMLADVAAAEAHANASAQGTRRTHLLKLAAWCRVCAKHDERLKQAIWPGLPKWQPTPEQPQQDFYEAVIEAARSEGERERRRADLAVEACDQARAAMSRAADERDKLQAENAELKAVKLAYERTPKQWSTAQAPTLESVAASYRGITAQQENEKLRAAIRAAGFAVMQTSGAWSIHDVSERAKKLEADDLERATRITDLEIENAELKAKARAPEQPAAHPPAWGSAYPPTLEHGPHDAPEWAHELRRQVAKLQAFKAYVHSRLDAAGVSADPESPHRAEGCRIGGRLDEVIGERDRLREARFNVPPDLSEPPLWRLIVMLEDLEREHGMTSPLTRKVAAALIERFDLVTEIQVPKE